MYLLQRPGYPAVPFIIPNGLKMLKEPDPPLGEPGVVQELMVTAASRLLRLVRISLIQASLSRLTSSRTLL